MSTTIIFDGKKFAEEKERKLMRVLGDLRGMGKIPKLTAIQVGGNPESELYLKLKRKTADRLGIGFEMRRFSGENPLEIVDFIKETNNDPAINGIMIELPLPEQLAICNKQLAILDAIEPGKDIDCLTSENLKLLREGKPRFVPPTIRAIGEILKEAVKLGILGGLGDLQVVVVGSKGTVGSGILSYLRYLGDLSNLRGVDKETKDLGEVTRTADILISATGVGHLVKKEIVKPGAIVIDVGIEKQPDGKLRGDADFENVKEVASFITPVPGGVGPVTIMCLMENLIEAVYH